MIKKFVIVVKQKCIKGKKYFKILQYILFFLLINNLYYRKNLKTRNNYLAFNYSISYRKQISNQQNQIKYIYFVGLNNFFFKQKFLRYLHVNTSYLIDQNMKQIYIQNIVNRLRKSGFFYSIQSSILIKNNIEKIIWTFHINPIIKTIKIKNIKKIKIPVNTLINIFNKQVGLPKNYTDISNSLQKIQYWYRMRGFKWITIKLLDTKFTNEIYIKINEGIIKKNTLICINQKNQYANNHLNLLIQKELNIFPKDIINLYRIELGILKLKKNKLISSCNYKITNDENNNIIIVFKYSIHNNRLAYLFSKQSILVNFFTLDWLNILYTIFFLPSEYVFGLISSLNQYLGFKYYLYHVGIYTNNLIIDIRNINNLFQLNCLYSHSYIKLYKNLIGNLQINIYNKNYELDSISNNNIYNFTKNKFICNFQSYGCKVSFQHNQLHNLSLIENLLIYSNRYNKRYLNIKTYNNYFIYINSFINKKIIKIAKQKMINSYIFLKYTTLNLNDQIKSGRLILFHSQHMINILSKTYKNLYFLKHSGQNLYFKYQEVFKIPTFIRYIQNHAFIFCLELSLLINEKNYLPILQQSNISNDNRYNNPCSFYAFNLEYQLNLPYYSTLYTYIHYQNHIAYYIKSSTLIYQYLWNKTFNLKSIFGIGIEINIPIKKIPCLRFEYLIHHKGKKYFQIKSSLP